MKHKILTLDEPAFQTWFGRQYAALARQSPEHALVTEILHNACTSLRALAPNAQQTPSPEAETLQRFELDLCTALHALDWLARHRSPNTRQLESTPPSPSQTSQLAQASLPACTAHTSIATVPEQRSDPARTRTSRKPARRIRPAIEPLPLRIQSHLPAASLEESRLEPDPPAPQDHAPGPNPADPTPSTQAPLARSVAHWRARQSPRTRRTEP